MKEKKVLEKGNMEYFHCTSGSKPRNAGMNPGWMLWNEANRYIEILSKLLPYMWVWNTYIIMAAT